MKKKILFIFLLGISASFLLWVWWSSATQAVNPQDRQTKIFVVQKGEGIRQVARRLQDEGLIRSKLALFLLVKARGAEKNIQAGTFRLSPAMKAETIINELSHGTLDIWVTVIEGWRNEETAALLEKELGLAPDEFLKAAEIGYMFPDTYAFPKETTVPAVVKIMRDNFNRKFDAELRQAAQKEELTEQEVIILASIVEREAKYDSDRPIVAGILLNRLEQEMPLQVDATIQYALDYQSEQKTWWKKSLTKDDLKIESPFNTYLNVDLPPTPISNPGLAAIQAAARPAKTDYLYYLSDKEGRMHYARILDEHNENIRKYLQN